MTATEVTAGSKGPMVRLLLSMCRSPEAADFPMANVDYEQAAALDPLREVFPNIDREIAGRRVIDFGCGKGYQAVGYALAGAESVIGVEIAEELLKQSKARVEQNGLAGKVRIEQRLTSDIKGDIIVSQNSFEHFIEPEATLQLLKASLAPGGKIYVTFGPPWYAPTGAHMGFFCPVPWIQVVFSEKTILEARSMFREDDRRSYKEAGLAQMSIAKFERVVKGSGLKISSRRYDCIKKMDFLQHLPVARELFINRVSCVLSE
jgi:SAM-dependent methyltransferase